MFEQEVDSDADFPDADLIIASDGANSKIRHKYAEVFKPDIVKRPNRFVWLGTTKLYDAFNFTFVKTEHGWFQAHVYKFDDKTTTFIVETPESVWLAHGLDKLDVDQSVAFCEKLFADHLQGHRLMSNARHLRGSPWLNFQRIKCEQWSLFNGRAHVVLMGDAVHTAHFAIGSGTKLAIEDAIELARQFKELGDEPAQHRRGAAALPGDPRHRRAAPAERRVECDGVVRGGRPALCRHAAARTVHVLDADPLAAHQPREPAPARREAGSKVTSAGSRARPVWPWPTTRSRRRRCSRPTRCAASR